MGVAKTGIVAFKVVLVFFDIKSKYDSWKNEHRVEASTKEAVSKKIEEIKMYEAFIDFFSWKKKKMIKMILY